MPEGRVDDDGHHIVRMLLHVREHGLVELFEARQGPAFGPENIASTKPSTAAKYFPGELSSSPLPLTRAAIHVAALVPSPCVSFSHTR